MTKEIQYPFWKTVVWRFIRSGVAGGFANLAVVQIFLSPDLSNASTYFMTLVAGFITGFISAGGLALRDVLSETKNDPIQKLPI